jgi:uncharacterized membrane protein
MSLDPETAGWAGLAASAVIVAAYEARVLRVGGREPARIGRYAHARIRADWVRALAETPGTEILAVQTLRNALMSATISASTAALALMGAVSLLGGAVLHGELGAAVPTVRGATVGLLLASLFASFVTAAMAVRLYNHAGFMTSMPAGSERRRELVPLATDYLQRAGHFHSWSLRTFFLVAPLSVGLLAPAWMPVAALGLVVALAAFDRVPRAA